jgi:hypothetical protein
MVRNSCRKTIKDMKYLKIYESYTQSFEDEIQDILLSLSDITPKKQHSYGNGKRFHMVVYDLGNININEDDIQTTKNRLNYLGYEVKYDFDKRLNSLFCIIINEDYKKKMVERGIKFWENLNFKYNSVGNCLSKLPLRRGIIEIHMFRNNITISVDDDCYEFTNICVAEYRLIDFQYSMIK